MSRDRTHSLPVTKWKLYHSSHLKLLNCVDVNVSLCVTVLLSEQQTVHTQIRLLLRSSLIWVSTVCLEDPESIWIFPKWNKPCSWQSCLLAICRQQKPRSACAICCFVQGFQWPYMVLLDSTVSECADREQKAQIRLCRSPFRALFSWGADLSI